MRVAELKKILDNFSDDMQVVVERDGVVAALAFVYGGSFQIVSSSKGRLEGDAAGKLPVCVLSDRP